MNKSEFPPQPALCDECLNYVYSVLEANQPLDFHWCKHREVLLTVKRTEGGVQNWSLFGPANGAEVIALFNDAQQTIALQMSQMRKPWEEEH